MGNVNKLYKNIIKDFSEKEIGNEKQFESAMKSEKNVRKLYDALVSKGYNESQIGNYDTFSSLILPKNPPITGEETKINQNPQDTISVDQVSLPEKNTQMPRQQLIPQTDLVQQAKENIPTPTADNNYMMVGSPRQTEYTKEQPSWWESAYKGLAAGIGRVGGGLLDLANIVSSNRIVSPNTFVDPYTGMQLGRTDVENTIVTPSYQEKLNDKITITKPDGTKKEVYRDPFMRDAKMVEEWANKMSMEARPYFGEKDFIDLLKSGEFGNAFQLGLATATESAPQMLLGSNLLGRVILGTTTAADQYAMLKEEMPDMPEWKRVSSAIGAGFFEQFFEQMGVNPVKWFKTKGYRQGLEEAERWAADLLMSRWKKLGYFGKNFAKSVTEEGLEEVVTSGANDTLNSLLDLIDRDSEGTGIINQYEDAKRVNPNLTIGQFALEKVRSYLNDFIGGAMAGAYMGATARGLGEGYSRIAGQEQRQQNEYVKRAINEQAQSTGQDAYEIAKGVYFGTPESKAVIDRANEMNIEDAITAEVDAISNNGNIISVTDGYGNEGVVVKGNIEFVEGMEGQIDRNKSDEMIYIRNQNGKTIPVPAKDLIVLDIYDAEAYKQYHIAREKARYYSQETFKVGDNVYLTANGEIIRDEAGNPLTSQVTSVGEDGSVNVEVEDVQGNVQEMTMQPEEALESLSPVAYSDGDNIYTQQENKIINNGTGEVVQEFATKEEADAFIQGKTDVGEWNAFDIMSENKAENEGASADGQNTLQENQTETQQNVNQAEQQTPSYPLTEDGEPDFSQMTAEQSIQVLDELGDQETIDAFIANNLSKAKKSYTKAEKMKPKSTSFQAIKAEQQQIMADREAAKAKLDLWSSIKSANDLRKLQRTSETLSDARLAEQRQARIEQEKAEKTAEFTGKTTFKESPKIEGNSYTRTLPDGTKIRGKYTIVPAESLIPSHDPNNNWETTEGFPTVDGVNVNDRDYKNDAQARQVTEQMAANYGGQAIENVPVVSSDGVVYDGNGRTIAGQIAAQNGTDAEYIQQLTDNAANYGFTPEQIASVNNPRLVLVLDEDLPYNTETFAKFNAQEKKTQSTTEKSVAAGKRMTESVVNLISDVLDSYSSIESLFGSEKATADLLKVLQDNGIIQPTEIAGLTENGLFSAAGREYITSLVLGSIFSEDAVRRMGNNLSLKNGILRAVPAILENRKLGEYSLIDEINEAITLLYEARANNMALPLYLRQTNAFEETPKDKFSEFSQLLASQLDAGVAKFRELLDLYNNSAKDHIGGQQAIFGEVTKEDIKQSIIELYGKRGQNEETGSSETETVNPLQSVQGNERTPEQQSEAGESRQTATGEIAQQVSDNISQAESEVNTNPTEAQKEAGNYKKGHVKIDGYDITIEQPKGSTRSGVDESGNKWETKMNNTYGYIRGTQSVDGDHIDVFLSDNPTEGNVYVVDQINQKTGEFDEHKVMYGFNSIEEAREAYLSNYSEGWKIGTITEVSKDEFKKWIDSSKRKTKPFSEYSSVNKTAGQNEVSVKPRKKLDLYKFVLKGDEKRPVLSGVHYKDGMANATDGHILVRIKTEYPKEMEGKTIKKNGEEVLGRYPNVESVLPKEMGNTFPVNIDELKEQRNKILDTIKKEWNDNGKKIPLYKYLDLSHINVNIGGLKIDMKYNDFDRMVEALEMTGINSLSLDWREYGSRLVGKSDDALILAILQDEENENTYGEVKLTDEAVVQKSIAPATESTMTESQQLAFDAVSEMLDKAGIPVETLTDEQMNQLANGSTLMTVYHGSGAKFDSFDHSFMGTGEGAQAYGWGSYVTEVEGIGRTYAESTSGNIFRSGFGDFYLREIRNGLAEGKQFDEVKEKLLAHHSEMYKKAGGNTDMYGDFISDYETLQQLNESDLPQRNLYTVEIPDNTGSNYLDWEKEVDRDMSKRLSEQLFNDISGNDTEGSYEEEVEKEMLQRDIEDSFESVRTGKDLYKAISLYIGEEAASKFLSRAGFVGISYPAQYTTGGRSDNARNYVIFNEKDLEIKDRISFMRGYRSRWENSGYTEREDGTKISRNAKEAEDNGTFTEGTFRKMYGVSKKDFNLLVSLGLIKNTEWHHTGKTFKRSDYYSWADSSYSLNGESNYTLTEEGKIDYSNLENSLAQKYLDNKKEISKLSKDFDAKKWEYIQQVEKRNIPSLEEFTERKINKRTDDYLTEEEKKQRAERHNYISTVVAQSGISSFERKQMHEDTDTEYRNKANNRKAQEIEQRKSEYQKEYQDAYGEDIRYNGEVEKRNMEAEEHNLNANNGKEGVLMQIAGIMGMDNENSRRITEFISRTAKEDEAKQARAEEIKAFNKRVDERIENKKKEIEKFIEEGKKSGEIKERTRIQSEPRYFVTTKEEMSGKYGWFEASARYNLPRYYSGIEFSNKESYDKYWSMQRELYQIQSEKIYQQAEKSDGIIYGATVGGKIYMNKSALNPETPIHEYTHIWDNACRKNNPELWNRGVELMKQTPVWEEVKNDPNYSDLKTDDEIASEVHSRLTGKDGSRILEDMAEQVKREGTASEISQTNSLIYKLKNWLSDFWYWVKDTMTPWTKEEASSVSLEDFINMPLKDLAQGRRLDETRFRLPDNFGETATIPINYEYGEGYYADGISGYFVSDEALLDAFRNKYPSYIVTISDDGESLEFEKFTPTIRTRGYRRYANVEYNRTIRTAESLAQELGLDVEIIEDVESLEGKKRYAKGWYDVKTKKIYVVLPNATGSRDVARTILHEGVAHYNLREMLGEDFDLFLDNIYSAANKTIRDRIDSIAEKQELSRRVATEEYLAMVAEDVTPNDVNTSWFSKVKARFIQLLSKLGTNLQGYLTDNDFKYIVWKSYDNLKRKSQMTISEIAKNKQTEQRLLKQTSAEQFAAENSSAYNEIVEEEINNVRYRTVTDPKEIEFLENQPKTKAYRAMQVIDGKLYSPMAAAVDGKLTNPIELNKWEKSEERPDLAKPVIDEKTGEQKKDKNGNLVFGFILDKGIKDATNKKATSVQARYNPYIHASRSPLNDQFKSAWIRPNLVTVEVEMPNSELTSGYKAEKAKDSVGEVEWKSGSVSSILAKKGNPRRVILSRYDKPIRVVKNDEVARMIYEMVGNEIAIPENVVTPQLRVELEKVGVKVGDPEKGVIKTPQLEEAIKRGLLVDNSLLEDTSEIESIIEEESNWESDIRFRMADEAPKTKMDIATESLLKAGARKEAATSVRLHAMKAIGKSLRDINKAIREQAKYSDENVSTLREIVDDLMRIGELSSLDSQDIRYIFSKANQAVTKSDLTEIANGIVDRLMDATNSRIVSIMNKKLAEAKTKKNEKVAKASKMSGYQQITLSKLRELLKDLPTDAKDKYNKIVERYETDETLRMELDAELEAYEMYFSYLETISPIVDNIKSLNEERDELLQAKKGKRGNEAKSYRETINEIDKAIVENKADLADALTTFVNEIDRIGKEGRENKNDFSKKKKARKKLIRKLANFDLSDIPAYTQEQVNSELKKMRYWQNSGFANFLFSPLNSLNMYLKLFGRKHAGGKGYLFNYFEPRQRQAMTNKYVGMKQATEELNKASIQFTGMDFNKLSEELHKKSDILITYMDGGKNIERYLTHGQALYLYMINKMSDGAMKLRKMGISEEDIENIASNMDSNVLDFADWIQNDFLPKKRAKYNKVHMDMFGVPMARIENYFPIRIAKGEVEEKQDKDKKKEDLSSTITGSIIKRTPNTKQIDLTSDALSVLYQNIDEMEDWAAYAQLREDFNTLIEYNTFKKRLNNMKSVHGAGDKLYDNFVSAIKTAVNKDTSVNARENKFFKNVSRGTTVASLNFNLNPAIKQLLGYPAIFGEADLKDIIKNTINPYGAFKWAMENLPLFEERVSGGNAGWTQLELDKESSWEVWNKKYVEWATKIGMAPNRFMDAIVCAATAKAAYDTSLRRYKKWGFKNPEEKALADAERAYNETQPSSQGLYISPMQRSNNVADIIFSLFRNANFAFYRRLVEAVRNLSRVSSKDRYNKILSSTAHRLMQEEGFTEEHAKKVAREMTNRQIAKDSISLVLFGYVMNTLWSLGSNWAYLLAGDDDDEKKKMIKDALIVGLLSPITGIPLFGSFAEDWMWSILRGSYYDSTLLSTPLTDEIERTVSNSYKLAKSISKDDDRRTLFIAAEFAKSLVNLCVKTGIGINPDLLTNMVYGVINAAQSDFDSVSDFRDLILTIINAPAESREKLIIDELGITEEGMNESLSQGEITEIYDKFVDRRIERQKGILAPFAKEDYQTIKTEGKQFKKQVRERVELKQEDNGKD